MKEAQKILEELIGSKPEKLTGEAKRLFEAIMKIADERDELLEKNKEYEKQLDLDYVEENYIHKDKIKAKIEELEKDLKEYENGQEWEIQDEIRGQIYVLQSLLEKE